MSRRWRATKFRLMVVSTNTKYWLLILPLGIDDNRPRSPFSLVMNPNFALIRQDVHIVEEAGTAEKTRFADAFDYSFPLHSGA